MDEVPQYGFANALTSMTLGCKMRRAGWDKGFYVTVEKTERGECLVALGKFPWLPSQEDLFAWDWEGLR